MPYKPLVSIICNCYNHSNFVIESIKSVQNQSYKNIELIVLNNGSEDNSLEVIENYLKKYPNIRFFNENNTLPVTQAFNKMVKHTSGEYLIDLSADDMLLPECVETLVCEFSKHRNSDVGIVFGNTYMIDENGNIQGTFFETDANDKVLDFRLHQFSYALMQGSGKTLCSVSAMMDRKIFDALNGYDETLFFEDLDYWYRLARKHKIIFIDKILVNKRVVDKSLGSQLDEKSNFSKKLNQSLFKIYNSAIDLNTKQENRLLLQRIHYSIVNNFKNSLWKELLMFIFLEIKCRIKVFLS